MTDLAGQTLGNYQIMSVLGRGGMATVYRAFQVSMDREVAIKVISPEMIKTRADFIDRFKREAHLIASLQHPHILQVFDFHIDSDPVYLVMALIKGESLDSRIRREPLPPAKALEFLYQIASALDYAHKKGIIHRDLKPHNIMLDEIENTYLMDFGIAKSVNSDTNMTAPGVVMGTPSYMAPEQWRGETLDGRTDIYALGIMFYEMLTGRLPFSGETPFQLMYQHLDAPLPTLMQSVPPALTPIIQKATAKKIDERYSSARQFADDVRDALGATATVGTDAPHAANVQPVIPRATRLTVEADDATLPPGGLSTAPNRRTQPGQQGSGSIPVALLGIAALVVLVVAIGGVALISRPVASPTPAQLAVAPSLTTVLAVATSTDTSTSPPTTLATGTPLILPTRVAVLPTVPAATIQPSATIIPPSQTALPTNTPVAPTITAVPPTLALVLVVASTTPAPPTATGTALPSLTNTILPPTLTATVSTLTNTPLPPTLTAAPPTNTAVPATATPLSPSATTDTTLPTLAPTAVAAIATPTGPGFIMLIFRANERLTVYISGEDANGKAISLANVDLVVTISGVQVHRAIEKYPSFAGLPFNQLPAPICFDFKNRQTTGPLPNECRLIARNNVFTVTLTGANLVWWDNTAGEGRTILFTRGDKILGQCPSDAQECPIFVPLEGENSQ